MLTRAFLIASVLLNSTTPEDNSTLTDSAIHINVYKPSARDMKMNVNVVRTIVFATLAITFAVGFHFYQERLSKIIGGALLAHRCVGSDYMDIDTRRAVDERRSEDRWEDSLNGNYRFLGELCWHFRKEVSKKKTTFCYSARNKHCCKSRYANSQGVFRKDLSGESSNTSNPNNGQISVHMTCRLYGFDGV